MRCLILAAALALAACATPTAHSPAADIAALEVALSAAEHAGHAYLTLPACPKAPLCSDPGISAQIKAADNKAYLAVVAARRIIADVQAAPDAVTAALLAAQTALTTLQNLVPVQVHP